MRRLELEDARLGPPCTFACHHALPALRLVRHPGPARAHGHAKGRASHPEKRGPYTIDDGSTQLIQYDDVPSALRTRR